MPHYYQYVDIATRGENILDKCYCSVKDAYKSFIRPGIGASDHHTVHLMPRYRQKIKREKPRKREIKVWDNESSEMLQAAFDITDWDVFRDECDDIHELTDTINSYVTFCEDLHIQSKEIKIYPNGKPWFNGKIKATIKEKRRTSLRMEIMIG